MHTLRVFSKEDAGGVKDLILSILTKEYPFDKNAYSDSDRLFAFDLLASLYIRKGDSGKAVNTYKEFLKYFRIFQANFIIDFV